MTLWIATINISQHVLLFPCIISNEVESSTIGGAMAGFIDCGLYKSPEEAKRAMVYPGQSVMPNEKNHKVYDTLYKKVYLKMYPSLAKVYINNKNFYLDMQKKDD